MVVRSDVTHLDEEIVTGINNITSISQILTKPEPRITRQAPVATEKADGIYSKSRGPLDRQVR